jgi:hypothetical protein
MQEEWPRLEMVGPQKKYWFWAWLVQATIAKEDLSSDDAACEAWENLVIINADDEGEAYAKALEIGKTYVGDSQGTLKLGGRPAVAQFLGVKTMGVIHDDLEDGAEITYDVIRCSQAEARRRVRRKATLLSMVKKELEYKKTSG